MEDNRDAAGVEKQPAVPMVPMAAHDTVDPAAFNPFKDEPNLNLFYSKVSLQPSKLLMDTEGCLLLPPHLEKWPFYNGNGAGAPSGVSHERFCYGLDEMDILNSGHASTHFHSLYSEKDSLRCSACPEVLWPLVNNDFLGFQKHLGSIKHLRNVNRSLKKHGKALCPIEGKVPKELVC